MAVNVKRCSLIYRYERFGESCSLHDIHGHENLTFHHLEELDKEGRGILKMIVNK